ncbi:MAG: RCC1 repeat-containing protein [Omnitrophica WOR_2 bacterium]
MKTKRNAILTLILILVFLWPSGNITMAQNTEPPAPQDTSSPESTQAFPENDPNRLAGRLLDDHFDTVDWTQLGLPENKTAPFAPEEINAAFIASSIAAGLSFTCALSTTGGVKCWGDNARGRLGDGTTLDRNTPGYAAGLLSGVAAISSSHKHTCALLKTGGVKCWGYNLHGELGIGTTTDSTLPVDVAGLTSGVVGITAGGFHTCALMSGGTVKCWGANWHGQVGDGTTDDQHFPVNVIGLTGVISVRAGKYHTCALINTGAVKCWGYNLFGQVGNGLSEMVRARPVNVTGLSSGVASISLGELHTCAVTTGGAVKCWGDNSEGQLGTGNRKDQWVPADVSGLSSGAAEVSAATDFTCARMATGTAKCWGNNWAGQLGDGTNTRRTLPVDVAGLSGTITAVETGDSHTCVVLSNGSLQCWGSNAFGQLGNGASGLRLQPVSVLGLASGVIAVTQGTLHACALTAAGGVKCWGNNQYGQLGDGTTIDRVSPVSVAGLDSGVLAVTAGGFHTCAILKTGGARCWGYNLHGELGDNSNNQRTTPVNVSGLGDGAIALAAGYYHTCALMSSGAVECWGYNRKGQLGNKTFIDSWTPVFVSGMLAFHAKAITAGEDHTCALTGSGGVKCWGNNFDGQLGDGTTTNRNQMVNVSGLTSGVSAIASGVYHTCALMSNGTVKCWGSNYTGQLGVGTFEPHFTPVSVAGSDGAVKIAAGDSYTCVLTGAGSVKCWGDNWTGNLGDGTTATRLSPISGPSLADILDLSAGSSSSCALTKNNGLKCWGSNQYGQVGDGTIPWQTKPAYVMGLNPVSLTINHTSGKPGSYLSVSGANFFPKTNVAVSVNGHPFTQVFQTDTDGNLAFQLDTQKAETGNYLVIVKAGISASVRFSLTPDGQLYAKGTVPVILAVPAQIAYHHAGYLPILSSPGMGALK